MHVQGFISFALKDDGAEANVLAGEQCWTARFPSLMEAVAEAFVNNLVDTEEACDAVAVETHIIPWSKQVSFQPYELEEMGFTLQEQSRQRA